MTHDLFTSHDKSLFPDAALTLKNTYVDQSSVDESADFVRRILPFLRSGDSDERVSMSNDLQEFVQLMKTLELSGDGIASLSSGGRSRITSMAWHPNPARFILASANVFGTIGNNRNLITARAVELVYLFYSFLQVSGISTMRVTIELVLTTSTLLM